MFQEENACIFLLSVMLKSSSASPVFNNFAELFLLYKQSSITWSRQIEKKIMALSIQFHYVREVYYVKTVQVEWLVVSLL